MLYEPTGVPCCPPPPPDDPPPLPPHEGSARTLITRNKIPSTRGAEANPERLGHNRITTPNGTPRIKRAYACIFPFFPEIATALAVVVTVSVELALSAPGVTEAELKEQLDRGGTPDPQLSKIGLLNAPPCGLSVSTKTPSQRSHAALLRRSGSTQE
jgi:hypothetical protein